MNFVFEPGRRTYVQKSNKNISIHKVFDGDDNWYLSVFEIGIISECLCTTDLNMAVQKAKDIIKMRIEEIRQQYTGFVEDNSELEFSQW